MKVLMESEWELSMELICWDLLDRTHFSDLPLFWHVFLSFIIFNFMCAWQHALGMRVTYEAGSTTEWERNTSSPTTTPVPSPQMENCMSLSKLNFLFKNNTSTVHIFFFALCSTNFLSHLLITHHIRKT